MAKKWRELYAAIPAEGRVLIEAKVKQDLAQTIAKKKDCYPEILQETARTPFLKST